MKVEKRIGLLIHVHGKRTNKTSEEKKEEKRSVREMVICLCMINLMYGMEFVFDSIQESISDGPARLQ